MYFEQACKEFKAGQVAKHFADWTKITSDREILSNISGVGIEVIDMPTQHSCNVQKFQPHEYPILDGEISKLLSKGVITKAGGTWTNCL